jgi:urease alpha subunit
MKCFQVPCPNPVAYTFHSGGLCIQHASDVRQTAPQVVMTPYDDEPTDPHAANDEGPHATLEVGSVYPRDKPGE